MKLFVGSDHAGFFLKKAILNQFAKANDIGCFSEDPVDYPDIAKKMAESIGVKCFSKESMDAINTAINTESLKVSSEENAKNNSFGVLICGTGIGMSISANRYKNIRAALCGCPYEAYLSRTHNDANVLCLGGRIIGEGIAIESVKKFIETRFLGGRHLIRINKII